MRPRASRNAAAVAVAVAAALLAGCATSGSTSAPSTAASVTSAATGPVTTAAPTTAVPTTGAPTTAAPTTAAPSPPATGGDLALVAEPDAGIAPIDALLSGAQHSVDLVMYELVDTQAEAILAADAARGVTVRVVLDSRLEKHANTPAYQYLNAHGVHAVWAPTTYAATHEKAAVIDAGTPQATALIMTLNLTSRYYSDTRDFAVIDKDPADVAAVESAFAANYAGQAPSSVLPAGADLVWSPGSEPALLGLINSATHSLQVENEEMDLPAVTDALAAAAERGVDVEVTMTRDSDWKAAFDQMAAAGVHVRTYADSSKVLYIHAKAIVADGTTAFVGSENFSSSSLNRNRELGLITIAPTIVGGLGAAVAADWAGATPWST